MNLCKDCYEKLKVVPNIVRTGGGRSCFGGSLECEECSAKVTQYVIVEILNKNIEPPQGSLTV